MHKAKAVALFWFFDFHSRYYEKNWNVLVQVTSDFHMQRPPLVFLLGMLLYLVIPKMTL